MYLARKCVGDRVPRVYPVASYEPPGAWRFLPPDVDANGESTLGLPFCIRQCGVAALAYSPAAAVNLLQTVL